MADTNNTTPPEENETGTLGNILAEKAEKAKYLILAALVILIAAAALFGYMRRSANQRDAAAKDEVFQLVAKINSGEVPLADAAARFGDIAKANAGRAAGSQAAMMQFAYTYTENKDYAAAETIARDFIKTYPKSAMIGRARLSLGQSLFQQGKIDEAITEFRNLAAANAPETLPGARLALAQALERRAYAVKDSDPAEFRTRLQTAETEYSDIIAASQNPIPSQRGFWPQAVTLPADYALVQIKDILAGYEHGIPSPAPTEVTMPEGGVMSLPPPAAETEEAAVTPPAEETAPAAPIAAEAEAAEETAEPVAEAAEETPAATESEATAVANAEAPAASEEEEAPAEAAEEEAPVAATEEDAPAEAAEE